MAVGYKPPSNCFKMHKKVLPANVTTKIKKIEDNKQNIEFGTRSVNTPEDICHQFHLPVQQYPQFVQKILKHHHPIEQRLEKPDHNYTTKKEL